MQPYVLFWVTYVLFLESRVDRYEDVLGWERKEIFIYIRARTLK